jgi:hypothetical protein
MLLARRSTRIGPVGGWAIWAGVSGWAGCAGRRTSGCSSTRTVTRRPARISAAKTRCRPSETLPAVDTVRSTLLSSSRRRLPWRCGPCRSRMRYTVIHDGTGPGQPLRPKSNAIRRAPHHRCSRRDSHRRFHFRRGLMRTRVGTMRAVLQPSQAMLGIAGQPGMHALAAHAEFRGNVGDSITGPHREDSLVSLLDNRQASPGNTTWLSETILRQLAYVCVRGRCGPRSQAVWPSLRASRTASASRLPHAG